MADCSGCRFWKRTTPDPEPPDRIGGIWGMCRRRAPVALSTSYVDGLDRVQFETASVFPLTMAAEWCGEWERLQ